MPHFRLAQDYESVNMQAHNNYLYVEDDALSREVLETLLVEVMGRTAGWLIAGLAVISLIVGLIGSYNLARYPGAELQAVETCPRP